MKPEILCDGAVQLHCADCRDVLPMLDKVDAILSDPPCGIAFTSEGNDRSGIGKANMRRNLPACGLPVTKSLSIRTRS